MSAVGLESIDHTVQLTHIWINDLDARLGWEKTNTVLPPAADRSAGCARLAAGQRGSRFWSTAARANSWNRLRALAAGRDAGEAAPE